MPRIRKKTSNRQSTNDRKKISQKARESRKKASKKSKKAPEQWKSKTKKDPGIPNNFPYKDEILKEMQESRRLAAEEKERQKEQNRARKASAKNAASEDVDMDSEEEDDSERKLTAEEVADGIADITARAFPSSKARSKQPAVVVVEDEEDEEVPVLLNRDLPDLGKTIDAVDAVVYVLDARDPLPFRSTDLEEVLKSKKKKVMFVLNKIDLCPKESVSAWLSTLQSSHPTFPFRSSSAQLPSAHETPSQPRKKASALFPKDDSWASATIISQLDQWATEAPKGTPLSVAVVGVTNVGKSSLINSLAQKSSLPVYSIASCSRGATTTTLPQEVTLDAPSGRTIRLIDTPGLAFQNPQAAEQEQEQADDDEKDARDERRALDILHRNRGRIDKLKDPKAAASQIIARASYEDLMLFYNLPAFVKGSVDSFLTGLARSQRLVKKRGEPDLAGACRIVLRDWNTGRFPWYAMPEASSSSADASVKKTKSKQASSAESAEEVLEKLQSRKEKMMSGGVVKMMPGALETRKVELTAGWVEDEEEEDEDDDEEDVVVHEEDVDGDDDEEMDDAEEGDKEEEEEEEEISPPPPPPTKGKRKASTTLQPTKSSKKAAVASESSSIPKPSKTSSKKVAFAAPASPSTTKESPKPPKKQLAASKAKVPSAAKTSKKGPVKAKA